MFGGSGFHPADSVVSGVARTYPPANYLDVKIVAWASVPTPVSFETVEKSQTEGQPGCGSPTITEVTGPIRRPGYSVETGLLESVTLPSVRPSAASSAGVSTP